MKRILLVLAVAAMMAVMLVVTAGAALAIPVIPEGSPEKGKTTGTAKSKGAATEGLNTAETARGNRP